MRPLLKLFAAAAAADPSFACCLAYTSWLLTDSARACLGLHGWAAALCCCAPVMTCLLQWPLWGCRVDVPAGVTQDVVGKANTAASYSYTYAPLSSNYQTVRTTANAVFGAIVGASVAASAGVAAVGGKLGSQMGQKIPHHQYPALMHSSALPGSCSSTLKLAAAMGVRQGLLCRSTGHFCSRWSCHICGPPHAHLWPDLCTDEQPGHSQPASPVSAGEICPRMTYCRYSSAALTS